MKKGKWSKEEDDLMKNHIETYGIGRSWQALAETLGLQRCGRSCRSRWLNYLRPGLKHGNFTPAEERIICEMYRKRGSSWSVIAAQLPGRTDLAVKNYWHGTLAKRLAGASSADAARRRRHRPSASTTSDATKPDELALACHDEESATTGSSCHAGMVDTPFLPGQPPALQARPPLATAARNVVKEEVGEAEWTERKQAVARALLLQNAPVPPGDPAGAMDMVCAPVAFMESGQPWATTGSSCHAGMVDTPFLAGQPPTLQARPALATAAGNVVKEEVGKAASTERKPAVARALLLQNAPAPPGDQASAIDMACAPVSPIPPLAFMEPGVPWVAGFDEIDSFLPWFDDWYSSDSFLPWFDDWYSS